METFEALVSKINEFVARDALYIASGFAIIASIFANFGLTFHVFFEKLKETSDINSLIIFVLLLFFSIISYFVGLTNREVYRIIGLVGVSTRGLHKSKFVIKLFKNISGREPPIFAQNARELLDPVLGKEQVSKNYVREIEVYKRAIFLKEIASTIGSGIFTSSLFIIIGGISGKIQGLNYPIWVIVLAFGTIGCLHSHYLYIREAKIAENLLGILENKQ